MKPHSALNWLAPLIFALALAAVAAGLFVQGGEGPYTFVIARRQSL